MPHLVGSTVATASPLFAIDFRLYSRVENCAIVNSCFQLKTRRIASDYMPDNILFLLRILAENTMRVSEALGILARDHIDGGRWLVQGKKRSRSYVISLPTRQLAAPGASDPRWQLPLLPYTYSQVYMWCCRCGVGGVAAGRTTAARTHAHRYNTAVKIAKMTNDRCAGDILHHNSNRAILAYLKKEEVPNGQN